MIERDDLWKLKEKVYSSRRGDYQLMSTESGLNVVTWSPLQPDFETRFEKGVTDEFLFAQEGRLIQHPWWQDEPYDFVMNYQVLYNELRSLNWLYKPDDRHNLVVNKYTCLTLVQYHAGVLYGYSRSTDMRNGYFADQTVLNRVAHFINTYRPDCKVNKVVWHLAVPHMYVKKGIARLDKENKR